MRSVNKAVAYYTIVYGLLSTINMVKIILIPPRHSPLGEYKSVTVIGLSGQQ